jgi:hypothetical protein
LLINAHCPKRNSQTAPVNTVKLTLFRATDLNITKMPPAKKRAKIIAALKDNPNAKAVARQVGGVCVSTVWRIAKWEGIELTAGKAARAHYGTRQKAPAATRHTQKS